jgi:hypothetical protein
MEPNGNVLASVGLETVQQWCKDYESALEMSNDGKIPDAQAKELENFPATTLVSALNRWALLKEFSRGRYREVTDRQTERASTTDDEAIEAARQLVRREPIRLTIAGHEVEVTGRSYNAMYEIAAHWMRVQEIDRLLLEVNDHEVYRRLSYELLLHRRAIWAHALTPSGAPAQGLDDCPSWWNEIAPQDDAALLAVLFRVMHGRYHQMGPPPQVKDAKTPKESFGWQSLLTSLETRAKVTPSAYYDRDLFQLVAHNRTANPPTLDEALEDET